jgi:hypothetical protein
MVAFRIGGNSYYLDYSSLRMSISMMAQIPSGFWQTFPAILLNLQGNAFRQAKIPLTV